MFVLPVIASMHFFFFCLSRVFLMQAKKCLRLYYCIESIHKKWAKTAGTCTFVEACYNLRWLMIFLHDTKKEGKNKNPNYWQIPIKCSVLQVYCTEMYRKSG